MKQMEKVIFMLTLLTLFAAIDEDEVNDLFF